MKLLHFADLHIGVETHGRPSQTTGWSTRLHDFLDAFDELVDTAIAERVDAVIFAGDAYKSRNPDQTHQREFAKRIVRLVRAEIPIYLLVGNHDVPNMISRANALEIFDTLGVHRVHIGSKLGLTVMQTRSGPLQIVGQPWPSVSQLLRRDEFKNLSLEEIDRTIEKAVAEGVSYYADQLDPSLPAVLTAHIAMSDSIVKTASEKFMTVGRFPQLNRSDLRPDAFDYIALGHHHCRQILHEHPPMAYAGSLQRVDFGEEDDPKGFYLVELDPAKPRGERVTVEDVQFREVAARRFITFAITPRNEDPTPEVLDQIARKESKDAVVRVLLTLTEGQNKLLDERMVRAELAEAHVLASVSRTVVRGARARLGADLLPESLTPDDAVRLWLESINEPADRREELLRYARALIDGDAPGSIADEPHTA